MGTERTRTGGRGVLGKLCTLLVQVAFVVLCAKAPQLALCAPSPEKPAGDAAG
jgi:hypothetical protein